MTELGCSLSFPRTPGIFFYYSERQRETWTKKSKEVHEQGNNIFYEPHGTGHYDKIRGKYLFRI